MAPLPDRSGAFLMASLPGRESRRRRWPQTPITKLQLVVPLPPMFSVWKFFAPSTW